MNKEITFTQWYTLNEKLVTYRMNILYKYSDERKEPTEHIL